MDSREALKININMADYVCMAYLNDLSDAEWMKRPHSHCNHLNWQVGHLVAAEHDMLNGKVPGGMPPLPAGFAEKYTKEAASSDDPSKFFTKDEILAVYKEQRAATLAALDKTSDSQLDAETGIDYAPTVGTLFAMQSCHWLMHCGQWVVVRRELGKPVVI